ncbi:MAG: stage II sporulation protein P, partial [Clostridia bacterium]|nr:stage II sporulation protein P [Clostridia bacterium]
MVRIKVVKASRLILTAAAVLLALALTAVIIGAIVSNRDQQPDYYINEAAMAIAASSNNVIVFDAPEENEHTDMSYEGFEIEVLPSETDTSQEAGDIGRAKRVLIYHTHTHEAYTRTDGESYVEETAWRTSDERYSIVRVGEELCQLLEGFGIEAVHDTTDHEPPKLATAYSRSLATLQKYSDQHFDLYIDLHRDAYDESMAQARSVSVGGIDAARLMVLICNFPPSRYYYNFQRYSAR